MTYKNIRTTETGKAVICPNCDNEELVSGEYCVICGEYIVNSCTGQATSALGKPPPRPCKVSLPGNARYCSICGSESNFFLKGWLPDWRTENIKKAIKNSSATVDYSKLKQMRG